MHYSRPPKGRGRGAANGLTAPTTRKSARTKPAQNQDQNNVGSDASNPNPPPGGSGVGGGAAAAAANPSANQQLAAGGTGAGAAAGAGGSGSGAAQSKGGKGVSRADLTALRSSFSKELEEMKASIMSSIGEALKKAEPPQQPHPEGGQVLGVVNLENEDEDDEEDGLDSEEEEQLLNQILKNQAAAKDPTALVEQPEVTSEVMGMEYLTKSCDVASIRDGKIVAAQSQMSSPDKKRTCRMIMMMEFAFADLAHTMAKSALMFPYGKAMKMALMKDQELASGLWKEEQNLVKARLDALREIIKREKAHLYLANDKTVNKHGYATIDQMEKMEELEKFTTKEQREAFKVASAQMDRVQGASKKRKRPGRKGGKPDPKKKPVFAKCADCGRNGHLAGDAKCPKAAEKKQ